MKVILVSPYSDKLVGGIINWTKYIINYQREHVGDVEMYLLNNEQAISLYGKGNAFQRLKAGLNNYLPICRRFKELVSKEHYDIVHVSSSASFGLMRDLIISRAARQKGIKVVVHMHFGRIPQILHSKGWENVLFKLLLRRIDQAIVMDMASYRALKDIGYEKVSYLPNPLSPDVKSIIEQYQELPREPRKIVYAGHITRTKGVFELVEACKQVENIYLDLLGYITSEEDQLELFSLAGEDSKSWLNIPGNKNFEGVIRAMSTCSIFVLPSYSEGFPNVILESMACGCPIISTPVGAIPEMLGFEDERPCGVSVPSQDVDSIKTAIVQLLNNPNLRNELGSRARQRVNEKYAMPIIWKELVDIWQKTKDS